MSDETDSFRPVFQTAAELDGATLEVERVRGTQALSGLYEFTVVVRHDEDGGLDDDVIDDLLVRPARLGLVFGNVFGIVRRIEMLPMTALRPTFYEITLVPKLWRLTLVRRSRVFQNMSHLDAVKAVLAQHGLDDARHLEDRTEETYPAHEYVVQYQETDLDFVRRLLAYNGIHYRFVHEESSERLVLGDRNASFDALPISAHELQYDPHGEAPDDGMPRISALRRVREPRVRSVVVRDYNWRTPQHPVRAEERADETGYGFADFYGEHVRDNEQAARLAGVRAHELLVDRDTFVGRTGLRSVRPGTYFDMVGHPNDALNQRYLVLATEERAEAQSYVNEFRAIPFAAEYRPPRELPWPRVDGLLTAIVDGDEHRSATPIDAAGQYRVVLPFDETAAAGGSASRWVRRAQPSAGGGFGMHFPLHIGTEVAVACVNGDPDRPVIVGAVPNAATPSPVVGTNAVQNRIRTGSGIVLELDDDC
ncbi:MAG: type VI secretion system tip protein VgrG [Sandaracinaceae bacterium]|nr:type VI secretion system tip protein VgrG [Sandaracinaceae bacterium]